MRIIGHAMMRVLWKNKITYNIPLTSVMKCNHRSKFKLCSLPLKLESLLERDSPECVCNFDVNKRASADVEDDVDDVDVGVCVDVEVTAVLEKLGVISPP